MDGPRISLKIWLQGACNTFLLQAHDTSGSISKRYSVITQNTQLIDICFIFLEYLKHLPVIPYHSVWSNATLNGGLYVQLTIEKYLTNINIIYVSFKKRNVINFNHRHKSLNKNAINEVTSLYKYYHEKLRLLQKA